MMMNSIFRNKKTFLAIALSLLVFGVMLLCSPHVFAATGDVAGVIEKTWKETAGQVKDIVNKVVFPAIDLILLVLLIAKLATCYFDYRKTGHFEFAGPAILFAGLVFALTAPLYIWQIIGI